jgi:lipopolysaccharide export system permease protein
MLRYQRYLLRQLLGPFVLVALGLTVVIWLTQSLRFIDLIVNKGLALHAFIYMSMLLLPSFLGAILPVALFCSILFVYNKLTMDSELISLRAAGVSQWALAKPALLLATVVAILSYSITMYFVPNSYREFKERQFILRSDYSSILLQEGVFNNLIDDVTVYIRAREGGGALKGILVHDSRIREKPITMMAESGVLVRTDEGPRFVLMNGNRQEINKDTSQLSLLYFDRYTMDLSHIAEREQGRWREPRERFTHELFNPSDSVDDQRNRLKFLAEAHNRIVSPLFVYALAAIGLAALLSGGVNRRGQWRRILVAIVAAFAFEAAGLVLVNMVAKNAQLIPLMYINIAVVIGASMLVVRRHVWRRSGMGEAPELGASG